MPRKSEAQRDAHRVVRIVDDLETEAIAKKLFKAWWGRRGPIRFEDQDTESWFAVARAAQRMGARSFTVIPRRTRT
jgi:hypothetical protein